VEASQAQSTGFSYAACAQKSQSPHPQAAAAAATAPSAAPNSGHCTPMQPQQRPPHPHAANGSGAPPGAAAAPSWRPAPPPPTCACGACAPAARRTQRPARVERGRGKRGSGGGGREGAARFVVGTHTCCVPSCENGAADSCAPPEAAGTPQLQHYLWKAGLGEDAHVRQLAGEARHALEGGGVERRGLGSYGWRSDRRHPHAPHASVRARLMMLQPHCSLTVSLTGWGLVGEERSEWEPLAHFQRGKRS